MQLSVDVLRLARLTDSTIRDATPRSVTKITTHVGLSQSFGRDHARVELILSSGSIIPIGIAADPIGYMDMADPIGYMDMADDSNLPDFNHHMT